MLFAAVLLLCFFPFLIVVSAFAGRSVTTALQRFLGLNHQAATDVSHLFTSTRATTSAITGASYVLFVLGGYAAATAFQGLYEQVYNFKSGGLRDVVRRIVWLAIVMGAALFASWAGHFVRDFGGTALVAVLGFLFNFVFFWFTMWFLLGGRASWRYLLPGALATSICWMGMLLVFWAVFSNQVIGDYNKYGPIGAVFAFMSFFIAIGVVVILGAMVGLVWRERRHPSEPSAQPKSTASTG
jgi:membrane protein